MDVVTVEQCSLFPIGVSVRLTKDGDTIYVDILSSLHMTKCKRLPHCYNAYCYTIPKILRDSDFLKYLEGYR